MLRFHSIHKKLGYNAYNAPDAVPHTIAHRQVDHTRVATTERKRLAPPTLDATLVPGSRAPLRLRSRGAAVEVPSNTDSTSTPRRVAKEDRVRTRVALGLGFLTCTANNNSSSSRVARLDTLQGLVAGLKHAPGRASTGLLL
jgi:hypothetical protein